MSMFHKFNKGLNYGISFFFLISTNRFYLGDRIRELDARMKQIKLPKIVTRNLRPLSERTYYHSYEWKYILLFAFFPLVHDLLPDKYEKCCALKSVRSFLIIFLLCQQILKAVWEADRLCSHLIRH